MPTVEIHIQTKEEVKRVLKAVREALGYQPCTRIKELKTRSTRSGEHEDWELIQELSE